MAIFLASTKPISRGNGQSAVASASYRAGVELEDKRYGKTHDYSKRHGVMSADIILPSSLKDKDINIDRGELWNLAEKTETRKNSRVAREWLINLPHELDEETRKQLAHDFAQALADKFGTIADCAIHQPTEKEIAKGADARNFHAHIMFTTRIAEVGEDGKIKLTDKADCEVSDTQRKKMGLGRAKDEVTEIRQLWETLANEKLAEHNHQLIDSRSYKAQGIDIEPQLKMGAVATKLERRKYAEELKKAKEAEAKGEHYEIDKTPASKLGEINEIINERNELVFNRELKENEIINNRAERIIFESRKNNEREQKNDRLRTAIERAGTEIKRATRLTRNASSNTVSLNRNTAGATQGIDETKRQLAKTEQAIADSQRAITASVGQRPNPFTDRRTASTTRREQSTSIFAEQKRRIADATSRIDRETRKSSYEDEGTARSVNYVKLKFASKLLNRNQDDMRIRWEWHETVEDYPHKYDRRQIELLDNFEKSIEVKGDYFIHKQRYIVSLIDSKFIEQHSDIIQLVNDPQSEREQYNERLTAWFEFKEDIDQKRADFNQSIIPKLGGSAGEVGRMTRDIISSFSYMKALDNFIDDDTQTADARKLAEQHRADTLNKTCQQFKLSYIDVLKLRDGKERNSYANALNSSLETFEQAYGSELSESQNKAIKVGLYSFERDIQQSQRMNYTR
ncbi:MobA/MobL family protein [Psychrobacter phenylpyruvicus]|uniref:MobA/MobL family protein n=1 Tax=Psychrobacter phenylpyruvicus TaxID=29432 RepID=UPI0007ABBE07|nr:MobA/MobL family protein [Psychrobacter phenylpyruvicus]